jgi:hypothetical protein
MKIIMIIASVFVFTSTFFCKSLSSKTISKEVEVVNIQDAQWELVKEQNGIEIFFKTIAKDGVFQLRVKFVNTKNEAVSFNWSLMKNSDSVFEETQGDINPKGSVEKAENLLIPFNPSDSYSDFLITLKIK